MRLRVMSMAVLFSVAGVTQAWGAAPKDDATPTSPKTDQPVQSAPTTDKTVTPTDARSIDAYEELLRELRKLYEEPKETR